MVGTVIVISLVKRMLSKILNCTLILFITAYIFDIPAFAYYSDLEKSSTNYMSSSTLDLKLMESNEGALTVPIFDEKEIDPDTEVITNFVVRKVGNLNTTYNLEMINATGDFNFCTNLDLLMRVDNVEVYSGTLANVDSEEIELSGNSDYLELLVRIGDDAGFQNKTCQFDIQLNSWQSSLSKGLGFEDTELNEENEIHTNGWIPYVKINTPLGGTDTIFVSGEDIDVTWEATSTGNLPDNTLFTQLFYSEDGGGNFIEIALLPTNLGTYTWTTPSDLSSTEVVLKVVAFNFDPFLMEDINEPFTISPEYNTNDILINEVFWSGSSLSTADEWVELYNNTGSPIDLTGWTLEGAGSGSDAVELSGSLDSGSYFLLTNYSTDKSNISDSIISDQVDSSISLNNSGEQLILKDVHGKVIDLTPVEAWVAGDNDINKVSMQRIATLGDGSDGSNWSSCSNLLCNSGTYWDIDNGLDFGTPKAPNL